MSDECSISLLGYKVLVFVLSNLKVLIYKMNRENLCVVMLCSRLEQFVRH